MGTIGHGAFLTGAPDGMLWEVSDSVPGEATSSHQTGVTGQPRAEAEEHTWYEPRCGVKEQVAV